MLSYVGLDGYAAVFTSLSLSIVMMLGAWLHTFANRKPRSHPLSPSNRRLPATIPRDAHISNLQEAATEMRPSKAEMLASRAQVVEREPPAETKSRGEARASVTWSSGGLALRLSKQRAENMDMDHTRLSIADFIWTCFFVGPSTAWLHITGIIRLKFREILHWFGLASPMPHDPAQLVYKMLVESFLTIHYQATRKNEDGHRIAMFMWHDVPALDAMGELWTMKLVTIEVDLDEKRMLQATVDERTVTEKETIVLIMWIATFVSHVRMHCVANWGINIEQSLNPFLRRMGVVTAIYNFYGFRTFPVMCRLWHAFGLTKVNYSKIAHAMDQSQDLIPAHSQIRELRGDSVLVDFVIKVRNHFLGLFAKHQCEFPGIDGEALLVGTIFHSLDHTLMEWTLEDPLWLDIDNVRPEFRGMTEVCRYVLMCFMKDLPFLVFNKRYSDAPPGSFFHKVYTHAASLNKVLADQMDCCVCK